MEFIKLLSAFGIGAVIAKVVDIIWVQPFLERKETRKWIRERRLEAYIQLSSNLLSFGFNLSANKNPFDHFVEACPSIILTDDNDFLEKIYSFIAKRELMFRLMDGGKETNDDPKKLYEELIAESKYLVADLRGYIRNKL